MRNAYLIISLVLFALTSLVALFMAVNPPQQHGRGMGAALLAGYVMLAWLVTAVNMVPAFLVFILGGRKDGPP